MSDNRAIVYVENGTPIYRASSIGLPLRCLTIARDGNTPLDPPDYLVKAADAGNRYEEIVKANLVEQGYIISDEQGLIELPITDVEGEVIAIIRGHLDGESIIDPSDPMDDRMLEVKSMSNNVFDQWQRHRFNQFRTYAWQVSTYMAATAKNALYVVINRDTEETEIIALDEPPVQLSEIETKVQAVEALHAQGLMPPCVGAKYQCDYRYMCDKTDIKPQDLELIGPANDAALGEAIAEYDAIRDEEKDLEVRKAHARDRIIDLMNGRERASVGLSSVSYLSSDRRTLDIKKLRAHMGDQLDKFYNTTSTHQLRVTKKKGSE